MTQSTLVKDPLVSVVTPFFNTAQYLAECIESVLAQSHSNLEYILLDNCSTDRSAEIAAGYARRDSRIRLIRCSEFLSQLANYNRALAEISSDSIYCKMVQADDWIFPDCLRMMVQAFEQSESIGLVSSYWLNGNELGGSGLAPQRTILPGRECAVWYLRTGRCLFATQTQVMYRSSIIRKRKEVYNVSFPSFADLQTHMEILEEWDFGFVHQVLSFSRRDNESILQSFQSFGPEYFLGYIFARRYAAVLVDAREASSLIGRRKRDYYRLLARGALRLRGRDFWRFHRAGLNALNAPDKREAQDWPYLVMMGALEFLWLMLNPGTTTMQALRLVKRSKRPDDTLQSPVSSSKAPRPDSFVPGHLHSRSSQSNTR
jgi:glycosyltransferase involved in cell wall biosynthesis